MANRIPLTMTLLALGLSPLSFGSDFIKGQLYDRGEGKFEITTPTQNYEVETTETIAKSLPSLANPAYVTQSNGLPYSYEFKGRIDNGKFVLEQTPTNIPGDTQLKGVLSYDEALDQYKIGDQIVEFGYTKVLNGYEFDKISKQSFVGKDILADGHFESDRFVIQALTPKDLFSASIPKKSVYHRQFQSDPYKFIDKLAYTNQVSKSQNTFREVVYNEKNYEVKPGESVFLVTLSGRQGDSFGSVNGHFVAGLGEVKDDLSLRAEVSNAYVVNGKDILSGNTSLTNYFSNLVQGQNNYRPTYTFIAYGMDKEKLQKFRNYMEPSHIRFRTEDLDITLGFNCTTETAIGLGLANIVGNHRRTFAKRVFDFNNLAYLLREVEGISDGVDALMYIASHDKEDFQPRPAFHSYIDSFKVKKVIKELGIKRMDYVFYAQIPSKRPIGGAPSQYTYSPFRKYDSLYYRNLYEKYENNKDTSKNLTPEQLLDVLPVLDKVQ